MKNIIFMILFFLLLSGIYGQTQTENSQVIGRYSGYGLEIVLYDEDIISEFEIFSKNNNEEIIWENVNVLFTLTCPGGAIPPGVMFFLENSIMVLNSSRIFSASGYRENRFFSFSLNGNEIELRSIDTRLSSEFGSFIEGIYIFDTRYSLPAIDFLGWVFYLD